MIDAADLIDEAVEQAGLDPSTLTARHINSIVRSIDLLFIEIEKAGANAEYRQHTTELAAAAGTAVILLPDDTIDVSLVSIRSTAAVGGITGIPLARISREQWLMQSDRTTTGHPTAYWVSKTLPQDPVISRMLSDLSLTGFGQGDGWSQGVWGNAVQASATTEPTTNRRCLVLWPGLAAASTVTVNRVRRMSRPNGLGGSVDADNFWMPILAVGLASKIAKKYNAERYAMLASEYTALLAARTEDEDMHPVQVGFRGFGWSRPRRH